MTTRIGTNQVGWDAMSIGFHSISGCTGMVVRTDQWVAGWHIGGGAGGDYAGSGQSKVAFQGPAFLAYLRQINPNPWPNAGLPNGTVALWNVNLGQGDWDSALQDFADLLGYHGQARGLDLYPKVGYGPCDVVITRTGGGCHIDYKRTSKMTHVKQSDLQRDNSVVKTIRGNPNDLVRTQDLVNNESASANVQGTLGNLFQMHRAATKLFAQKDV